MVTNSAVNKHLASVINKWNNSLNVHKLIKLHIVLPD